MAGCVRGVQLGRGAAFMTKDLLILIGVLGGSALFMAALHKLLMLPQHMRERRYKRFLETCNGDEAAADEMYSAYTFAKRLREGTLTHDDIERLRELEQTHAREAEERRRAG